MALNPNDIPTARDGFLALCIIEAATRATARGQKALAKKLNDAANAYILHLDMP